jgi:hypothetical protein
MSEIQPKSQNNAAELTERTLLSDLSEADKTRISNELEKAKAEFKRQTEEAERDFWKFLFAANSGGAVAFLAFLNKSAQDMENSVAIWPLSTFGLGVIFVGMALMTNAYGLRQITISYIEDEAGFKRNAIPLLTFIRNVKTNKMFLRFIDALCIFSFAAFILGCLFAYNVLRI